MPKRAARWVQTSPTTWAFADAETEEIIETVVKMGCAYLYGHRSFVTLDAAKRAAEARAALGVYRD